MKTTSVGFLAGIAAGFVVAILTTPISGSEIRRRLFNSKNDEGEWEDRETYSINELLADGSSTFNELKEKINQEER
jgi:gas vesicle protein